MRILHIIDSLCVGGAQSLLVDLTAIQKQQGNDVEILQLIDSKDRTLINKITTCGIKVVVSINRLSVYNPLHIFGIIPYLKKFDIVHVHLFPALYWVGFAKLLSFSRTPLVYTEHSTKNRRHGHSVLSYTDRFIYKFCYKEIAACSDKVFQIYHQLFPNVRCCSIPNGIDLEKYKNAIPYTKKELLGINEDNFVICMVARFAYPKRQDTIIRAISELPQKFHGVFVGGKESNEALEKAKILAEELNISDRIHFLYTRPDVPRILKTADAIVMSSEYEGLSLSSIEGMACGKPFIATNVNGLREVVRKSGILFENGAHEELAKILQHLAEDSNYYHNVVDKCMQRSSMYDIGVVEKRYMDLYQRYVSA